VERFVIGVDFGTLSARTVLVEAATGVERAWSEHPYEHGVIESSLPGALAELPPGAVRQQPRDYLKAMRAGVRRVLEESSIRPQSVIGIGIDFTSSTVLPVSKDDRPLCWDPCFRANPHAWVHLWKDQTAQAEATLLTQRARARGEEFLKWYGDRVAADSFFPKVWQVIKAAPDVFESADQFIEAGDWVVRRLTGKRVSATSSLAYKALWDGKFPCDFLGSVDPSLRVLVEEKTASPGGVPGTPAGGLCQAMAEELGLEAGTPVAVATIDAHAALLGAGVAEPGTMVLVLGTSACHMILDERRVPVRGICGGVQDGIVPGLVGYEAGQPAVGDMFSWFGEHFVPAAYQEEAKRRDETPLQYLEELAAKLTPGSTGLVALDWWNGNRSPLGDGDLSGLVLGFTLQTRPEDVYRALMESAVFGTFEIIRTFEEGGVPVRELCACGGIATRSPLMMQMLADVTGRSIHVATSQSASALGAAIYASVAAGAQSGGHESLHQAVTAMTTVRRDAYRPDAGRHQIYGRLYNEYAKLSRLFGVESPQMMQALKTLRTEARLPWGEVRGGERIVN